MDAGGISAGSDPGASTHGVAATVEFEAEHRSHIVRDAPVDRIKPTLAAIMQTVPDAWKLRLLVDLLAVDGDANGRNIATRFLSSELSTMPLTKKALWGNVAPC
jgi:hypothetical protein